MVRAILEGKKTVTRRLVKGLKTDKPVVEAADGTPLRTGACWDVGGPVIHCPYGKPGERLWVRETWAQPANLDPGPTVYRATYPDCLKGQGWENLPPADSIRWKPSIHMFRRNSRIPLEITEVRVERLQEIDDNQAQAEGIGDHEFGCNRPCEPDGYPSCSCGNLSYVDSFQRLWSSVGGDWGANPWVWVVEFKQMKP